MKKIIIAILVFAFVAFLPFFGNKVIKENIKNNLTLLRSYGLSIKKVKDEQGYLHTTLGYKFVVKDKEKFLLFLQQFSSSQLPPYTKSLIDEVEFEADITFNNVPLSDKVDMDLYPLKLPKIMKKELMVNSPRLYKAIRNILDDKAILYHIRYSVVQKEFNGYIKDFNRNLAFNDTKFDIKYSGIKFQGYGLLLAPEKIRMNVKNLYVEAKSKNTDAFVSLKNLTTMWDFEDDTTFSSTFKADFLQIKKKDFYENFFCELKNFYLQNNSDTQTQKAQFGSKADVSSVKINYNDYKFKTKDFKFDMILKNIDKDSFLKIADIKKDSDIQTKSLTKNQSDVIYKELLNIIKNGFEFKIKKFTFSSLYKDNEKLGDFDLTLDLKLKEDKDFLKYQNNPNRILKNLFLVSNIKLSKKLNDFLVKNIPILNALSVYKKEQNQNIIYDIKYNNR
jgi:hypothetical protein